MRLFKSNLQKNIILITFISVIAICAFLFFFNQMAFRYDTETTSRTYAAIIRGVVSCYAIEGIYPPDIKYLQDHYGLQIDEDKYFIFYEVYASNIMPNIEVFLKK